MNEKLKKLKLVLVFFNQFSIDVILSYEPCYLLTTEKTFGI